MSHDIDDIEYKKCVQIIDRLEDLEATEALASMLVCLCFNYDDAKNYILNYHSDVIDEEE